MHGGVPLSALLASVIVMSAGCGSESGPDQAPTQVYQVTAGSSSSHAPDATHTVVSLNLIVTNSTGAGVGGAVVRLQATAGTLEASEVTADASGGAVAVWTLPIPQPATYSLSACSTTPVDAPCTYEPVWSVP